MEISANMLVATQYVSVHPRILRLLRTLRLLVHVLFGSTNLEVL